MSEKDLARALNETPPGYSFSDRELLNITRVALARVFTGRTQDESANLREAARQALARLEGCTELPGGRANDDLTHQQWIRSRSAEFRRNFISSPEARARARQLNDEANTGQEEGK
jgi:hypothetical protein